MSPWLAFLLGASAGACLAVLILGALQSRLRYIEIIQMDVETGQLARMKVLRGSYRLVHTSRPMEVERAGLNGGRL